MLKYPNETNKYQVCDHSKMKNEYLLLLEKTLRTLGNFKDEDPIVINKYKQGEYYLDIIYEVEDKSGTSFKFYNFATGSSESTQRYNQSFELIMTKKNSNISYKYYFKEIEYDNFNQILRMTEISYHLSDNLILRLERQLHSPIRLIVEEGNKKYILGFYKQRDDYDIELLKDFGNILENFVKIEHINLENIIGLLKDRSKLNFVYIYKDNKVIASIDFLSSNVQKYEINQANKKIKANVINKPTRIVEREINGQIVTTTYEITEENYQKIHSDYKKLFKQL